jgi:C4-dicarboxylate transporter DctQ subunit
MNRQPGTAARGGGNASRLRTLDRWLARVEDGFTMVAALCIFALMFLGIAQVLGRQLFDRPVAGYIDFVELSMATFAFLGIAYCQREGGHVRMDLFVKMARGRLHWLFELFGVVVALVLIGVLVYYGWDHFMRAYDSGDSTIDMELAVWPSKLLVPVSFGLLFLRLLVQTAGYLRLLRHPEREPVGVPRMLTVEDLARREIEESIGEV